MEVTTRQLRCIVMLAEELSFTRAAARLYVAQQALSATVRQVEERLGVQLVERTTRRVRLTPAGEAFVEEARVALAAIDRAAQRARRMHFGEEGTLRLGMLHAGALELTAPILNEFRSRLPHVHIELCEYRYTDPSVGLADASVDVAILRPPIDVPGVELEVLFREPRVVVVAATHPLAARARVTLADVLAEPVVIARCADRAWNDFWLLTDLRDGRAPTVRAEVSSMFEELETVAAGLACTNVPAGYERYSPHPALRFLRVEGLPPTACAVGWRRDRQSPLVEAFVASARAVRDRETALVAAIEHPF